MSGSRRLQVVRFAVATFALAAAVLVALLVSNRPIAHAVVERPNILFIVSDDQRFATLGMTDPTTGKRWMENTTSLFKDNGTTYQWAFDSTPECCPSRASIFTGRYGHNHGVHSILNGPADAGADKLDQTTTLQRYLKQVVSPSYHTGIFGKYFNSWDTWDNNEPAPYPQNPADPPQYFDDWGILNSGYTAATVNDSGGVFEGANGVSQGNKSLPSDFYSTSYVRDQAVNFIHNASTSQPWFLYVAPYAPHRVSVPEPGKYDNNYPVPSFVPDSSYWESDMSDKPPYMQNPPGCCGGNKVNGVPQNTQTAVSNHRADQLRTLKSVDDLVGAVYAEIQARGMDSNTLAFFISDNGYMWGEHQAEGKLAPYTFSTRIPLFARWPGHVTAGAVDTDLVANIDLAPTVASVLGFTPNPAMDGKSLFGTTSRDYLLMEFWQELGVPAAAIVPTWSSIRSKPGADAYQYTEYGTGPKPDFREYYLNDFTELNNLYGGNGKRDAGEPNPNTLSQRLGVAKTCGGASCP
jgi:arylsulfatase A-like enzyme